MTSSTGLTEVSLLPVVALMLTAYIGLGLLVARRVRERSAATDGAPFLGLMVVFWPLVAAVVQVRWLLGRGSWHLR